MSEKQAMTERIRRKELLKGIVTHPGWIEIKSIFQKESDEALRMVKDINTKDDDVKMARLKMNVIDGLIHQIDLAVGFGEQDETNYKRKYGGR